MSNWSVVILNWSAVDDGPKELTNRHRDRLREVDLEYDSISGRGVGSNAWSASAWVEIPPCPEPGSPGGACEFVAVTHINHFVRDELMVALAKFPWEMPEEVQVLWKNEEMERFEVVVLADDG